MVPIISKTGQSLDMVISRNPLADEHIDYRDNSVAGSSSRDMWDGRIDGIAEETV